MARKIAPLHTDLDRALPAHFGNLPPPVPLKRKVSRPIDLGDYNEAFRGTYMVFHLTLPMLAQDLIAVMQDQNATSVERGEAAKEWLKISVAAWNLAYEQPDGTVKVLKQPFAGGIDEFPMDGDLIGALSQAFGAAFNPPSD